MVSANPNKISSLAGISKSGAKPFQVAKGRIRIRPYRDSDSEPVRALFIDAFGTGKGSILRAALKGQLADKLSMCLYTIGSISLCSQAIHLSTRYSSHSSGSYSNGLVYLSQAVLLAALATFLNRAYNLYLAVMKFIQLGLDGDMLDIGEHYCWRSLQLDDSEENERRKNGYWVAELIEEDGSSIIVGGTGIDVTTARNEPSSAELRRMVVSPLCRRRGVGAQLIEVALDHTRKHNIPTVYINTSVHQHSALSLYEKFGWVRQRDFWYLGSMHVTTLKLDLKNTGN